MKSRDLKNRQAVDRYGETVTTKKMYANFALTDKGIRRFSDLFIGGVPAETSLKQMKGTEL
jgi:hypothetical protein